MQQQVSIKAPEGFVTTNEAVRLCAVRLSGGHSSVGAYREVTTGGGVTRVTKPKAGAAYQSRAADDLQAAIVNNQLPWYRCEPGGIEQIPGVLAKDQRLFGPSQQSKLEQLFCVRAADFENWYAARYTVAAKSPDALEKDFLAWMRAEKTRIGTYPPLSTNKRGLKSCREWAQEHNVARKTMEIWRGRISDLNSRRGPPQKDRP